MERQSLASIENLSKPNQIDRKKKTKANLEIDYIENKLNKDSDSSDEESSDSEVTVDKEISDNCSQINMQAIKTQQISSLVSIDQSEEIEDENESLIIQQSLEEYEVDPVIESAEIYELFSSTIFEDKKNDIGELKETLESTDNKENINWKSENKRKGRPRNSIVSTRNEKI